MATPRKKKPATKNRMTFEQKRLSEIIKKVYHELYFVVFLIWFCHDRAFLASQGAFVPHWLWFLFVPVYIYKRQKRNGNSRWWVVFWLISVIMGLVVSAATMAVFHPQGY